MFDSSQYYSPAKTLCLVLVLFVTACSKHDANKSSTQVAAQVDGTEISLLQINQVLRNAPAITPENAPAARKQVLNKLIDQQVIVKKALDDKLDRSPEVMVAIEAAKKDILAKAYLQNMVANTVKISNQEVKNYYTEHPGLFEKRRIYELQDIGLEKNPQVLASIKQQIAQQKNAQAITDWLTSQGVRFTKDTYTRAAEQIPLEVLPQIQNLKPGEVVALEIKNSIHVVAVLKADDAPVAVEEATPVIKNYLMNLKAKQVVENKMKQYRSQANVVLLGEFSSGSKADTNKAEVALANKQDDKDTKNQQADKDKASIERGITGL